MTDTDLERRLSERLHREAAQLVPDGEIPPLPAPSHRWWQLLRAAGSPRWRAPVLVVAAVLVIGLVTAALVRWLPRDSATPAANEVPVSVIVDRPAPGFDCEGTRTAHAARTDAAIIGITVGEFCLTVPLGGQQRGGTDLLASGPLRAVLGTQSILGGVVDPSVTAVVWVPRTGDNSPTTLDLYQLGGLRGFAFPSEGDGTLVLYSGSKIVTRKDVPLRGPAGALAASSRAASSGGASITAIISRGGVVPAEQICVSSAAPEVIVPLATYGDQDSAALRFVGGSPPAALLCGTFTSGGRQQHGSAASTPGHIAYLFSQVNPTKVSSGGGYYWIAGAVDSTVASVVLSFPDTPTSTRVDLVPLAAGWQGFADEYSPAPIMPDATAETGESAGTGVTVTALDDQGNTIDARYINLDTGAAHQVTPTSATPRPTR